MAEGRMLKKKITKSKKLAALKTDKARLLWFYMLPFTDIEGRLEADAEDIRDEIIRKQRKGYTIDRIEECLRDLHEVGLIILYSSDDRRFLEYSRFADEQTLRRDKEAESIIPSLSTGAIREHDGISPAISKVKLSKDKLSKDNEQVFNELWNKYPRKLGKTKAFQYFNTQIKNQKDIADVRRALANYLLSPAVVKGDTQYILHGATFFNERWRDWVDYKEVARICAKCKGTGIWEHTIRGGAKAKEWCHCEAGQKKKRSAK